MVGIGTGNGSHRARELWAHDGVPRQQAPPNNVSRDSAAHPNVPSPNKELHLIAEVDGFLARLANMPADLRGRRELTHNLVEQVCAKVVSKQNGWFSDTGIPENMKAKVLKRFGTEEAFLVHQRKRIFPAYLDSLGKMLPVEKIEPMSGPALAVLRHFSSPQFRGIDVAPEAGWSCSDLFPNHIALGLVVNPMRAFIHQLILGSPFSGLIHEGAHSLFYTVANKSDPQLWWLKNSLKLPTIEHSSNHCSLFGELLANYVDCDLLLRQRRGFIRWLGTPGLLHLQTLAV